MALQHVLDTARKLGIPIVITDEAGEAAQVVMPFDDFVAMVGSSVPAGQLPVPVKRPRIQPLDSRVVPERDEISEALADLRFEEITEQQEVPPLSHPPMDGDMDDGFLEEKFYLEPLDDQESLK